MPKTHYIAQAGVIAAVYGALTWLALAFTGPFAWMPVQVRVSEAVTILAIFTPAAIPGLTIGSLIANLANPQAVWPFSMLDVVFGSLGTLLGAIWSWRFRKRTWLALLGPVVTNALIVPAYLPILIKAIELHAVSFSGVLLSEMSLPLYGATVATVAIGQAVAIFVLGLPLLVALRKTAITGLFDR